MAPTVTITRRTTTASKVQYMGCTTFHANTSDFDGVDPALVDIRWRVTAYPAGFTYEVDDPRTGHEGETLNLRDDGVLGYRFAVPNSHAGSYTVTCDFIYGERLIASSTNSYTIAAFSGATRYLDASATGAEDGTSPTDAWTTFQQAIDGIKANSGNMRVLVKGSQTYNHVTGRNTINHDNWSIEWDGEGTKPIWELSGMTQPGAPISMVGAENATIYGLAPQDSNDDDTQGFVGISSSTTASLDCLVHGNEIPSGKRLINPFSVTTALDTTRFLLLNNEVQEGDIHSCFIGAPDTACVFGGFYGESEGNRCIRITAAASSLTAYGVEFENPNQSGREAIRFVGGTDCSVYACRVRGGSSITVNAITVGPLNIKYNDLEMLSGGVGNSVTIATSGSPLTASVSIIGNRCYADQPSEENEAFEALDQAANTYVHGNTVKKNLNHTVGARLFTSDGGSVEANLFDHFGTVGGTPDFIDSAGATFPSVKDNVFSTTGGYTKASPYFYNSTTNNLATLNGESWASGNIEADRVIDTATFVPASYDSAETPDGMFFDYYGLATTPGSTSVAGAVHVGPTVASTVPADAATGVSTSLTSFVINMSAACSFNEFSLTLTDGSTTLTYDVDDAIITSPANTAITVTVDISTLNEGEITWTLARNSVKATTSGVGNAEASGTFTTGDSGAVSSVRPTSSRLLASRLLFNKRRR